MAAAKLKVSPRRRMVLRAICKDADQIVTSPASPGSALFRDEREGRDGNVLHAPDAIVGCGTACAVFSQPQPWQNELECRRALPKMESAVTRLMRYDPSALKLFGTITGGPLNPSYFVSYYQCLPTQAGP